MEGQRASVGSAQDRVAAERFAEQLRVLRTAVGNPSFRKMAGRSGRISHTTLHEAAAGARFPSWETTREFVRACEADEALWRRRWEDAQSAGTVHTVPDGNPALVIGESSAEVGSRGNAAATTTGVAVAQPSGTVTSPAPDGPLMPGIAASSGLVLAGQPALRAAERPPQAAGDEVMGSHGHRLPWLIAAVAVVLSMVTVLGVTVHDRSSADDSGAIATPSTSAGFSDALIPGDSSQFVADVTIPDGTRVKVNAHFVKVWALANVGTVHWHNRFLARTSPAADDDGCQVPDRVTIGDTAPGERVMISVPVTAPNRPGQCWVSWKMVDEHGQQYFPSRRPVYFMVTVTA